MSTISFLGPNGQIFTVTGTINANGPLPVSIASGPTPANFNLAEVGGANVVTGGIPGLLAIAGSIADGAADDGSGVVKVGGVARATAPIYTTGERTVLYIGLAGQVAVMQVAPDGFDLGAFVNNSDAVIAAEYSVRNGTMTYNYNGASFDRIRSIVGALVAGNTGLGTTAVEETGRPFINMVGATTNNAIKTGHGFLHTVVINTPVANGSVAIYDGVTAAGTPIATITLPAVLLNQGPNQATFDAAFTTGLTIVTTGAGLNATATYR